MVGARRRRAPEPDGSGTEDHSAFEPILDAVAAGGVAALARQAVAIDAYLARLTATDPDDLTRDEALAYWLNLYNAGALDVARRAFGASAETPFRLPGGFTRPFVAVAGEHLSLDDVEHGKVRRFRDPRVHAALVCGSVSCPTLRSEPYRGELVREQLDDQMRSLLREGGAVPDRSRGTIALSRLLRWYGGDFTRPHRMPVLLPSRSRAVLAAITRWLEPEVAEWATSTRPRVTYQPYDWTLGCTVGLPGS
jgi:hypothetical protein